MADTALRCTLPGCSCECFNPCKTQLRTCQVCQHGWVAHDSLTEEQVSKIRKKGAKHGRSCQHPRCDCDDYKSMSSGIQASWLMKCTICKHSNSDHRLQTHFDKLRTHNVKHASTSACVGCRLNCQGFGKPEASILQSSPLSKQCTLCGHSVENHRPTMETDITILSAARECQSIKCQKVLADQSGGKREGYDMHDWLEAVNVDPDERKDVNASQICYCRGFIVDDPARICQSYYGLPKEIVLPHLQSINCQRCSHELSDHHKLNENEQRQRDKESEFNLTLLSMSKMRLPSKNEHQLAELYSSDNEGAQRFGLARILKHDENKTSLRISLIAINAPESKEQVKEIKRKRTNSGKFMDAVKSKFKRRKLMNNSDASDDLRSDESTSCSESDSSFTKLKKKFKKSLENVNDDTSESQKSERKTPSNRNTGEVQIGATPEELMSTVTNTLMDSVQEMVTELPKQEVTALAWGKSEGTTDLALGVGFEDGSVLIYKVNVGVVTQLEKCSYNSSSSVSRLLWITQNQTQLLAICQIDGTVEIVFVTKDGISQYCMLENHKRSKVTAIAASPNGRCICIGQQDGSVLFYMLNFDGSSPKFLSTSSISYGTVRSIAWHPSKNVVVVAGEDDNATVFYMETLADRKKDKTRGTIMHYLGKKRRFDLDVFTMCCNLKGHVSFVAGLTFDPTGSYLTSVGWDGQILFWNTADIDDVISCGAGDVSTIECSTGYMIGQRKFENFPSDGLNFIPISVVLDKPVIYILAYTDIETICLVAYLVPKKYR